MQVPIANSKLDISFANSLARLKTDVIIQIVLHAVQFITMIVMIPIEVYVYKHNN
jgi:aryl-alcohol dehydrogenase-like predicted oxidoreductase